MPPENPSKHVGPAELSSGETPGPSLAPPRGAAPLALGAGAYTLIHGSWYDLSKFSHPGGPVALGLAYGRDATVLFEQSHVFTDRARLAALLAPLRAPPELSAALHARFPRAADEATCFDFDAAAATLRLGGDGGGEPPPAVDAFEADVKALALRHFAAEAARRGVGLRAATKAPPVRWAHFFVLLAAFLASVPPLLRGWWPALLITPTLCWLWMCVAAARAREEPSAPNRSPLPHPTPLSPRPPSPSLAPG